MRRVVALIRRLPPRSSRWSDAGVAGESARAGDLAEELGGCQRREPRLGLPAGCCLEKGGKVCREGGIPATLISPPRLRCWAPGTWDGTPIAVCEVPGTGGTGCPHRRF